MIRPKPFLTYFILCAIPLLLLAALNYWNGLRTVDSTVSTIVQDDLYSFNVAVDEVLRERGHDILRFAIAPVVQDLLLQKEKNEIDPASNSDQLIGVRDRLKTAGDLSPYFQSLTIFGNDRRPFGFRIGDGEWTFTNINSAKLPQADQQLWASQGNVLSEWPGSAPGTFEYGAPVNDARTGSNLGAVVGVLDLQRIFAAASRGLETRSSKLVVVDRTGKTIYNSDKLIKPGDPLPGFESISREMAANATGVGQVRLNGSSYQYAYGPIPQLGVGAAIARRRSDFTSGAHLWGMTGLVLAVVLALAAAFALERHVKKRSRGIEQVTQDLSAIAKGELDRRIILQSSDDARGIADNINVVTERLRAQIAREEESRQFESFVRLSAMLTHDLKNAIEGLSLTVANMERHFDNPQFRTDALKGLTSATDKLKALVARLARPLTSLSGEHKRPANVDLMPILQRVIAMTAEPVRGKHTIVTRLPQNLYALVDAARIEEVMENLVLNALEAMDTSGTLTIEAGQTPSGAPTFSVSDTGRGMSKTFIETRLYRPFSTTKKTGIGLGLYTCREVILASAGSIEVDSVEGAGTTFRVVLPSIPHDRRN